jgi:2,5-furandicarboxylate decarboxylase 1
MKDLRGSLEIFKEKGEVQHVRKEVDWKFELAGVYKKLDGRKVVFFDKVKGYNVPVVSGMLSNRRFLSFMFGVDPADPMKLLTKLEEAYKNDIPPNLVDSGPCKENIITREEEIDVLKYVPVPHMAYGDAGRYITAGIVIAKDPETGWRNFSIHRICVVGKRKALLHIDKNRRLGMMLEKAAKKGIDLEIAVAIGVHPFILLAATSKVQLKTDKFGLAGSFLGEAIEVVKGETVDLEIPAHSEFVIEGKLTSRRFEKEGPFQEYPGTYSIISPAPIFEISAITFRNDPIYYAIIGGSESHILRGIQGEYAIYKTAKAVSPIVKKVHLTPASLCRHHAIIQVKKEHPDHEGLQRNVMFAVLAAMREVDIVVVVDEDIDIYDPADVEWAIATRFDAGKDLLVFGRARSHEIIPITEGGIRTKIGIDATVPFNMKDKFKRAEFYDARLEDYL